LEAAVSSYLKLAEFLAAKQSGRWDASFDEVERVLGRQLPNSAYRHQAWWANQTGPGHSQTRGWRSVGWRTAKLDLERRRVSFERERDHGHAARPTAGDRELWREAADLTGIADRADLTREALRALIAREAAGCLIAAGGTMPDFLPAPRERPDA
jgi:hypothetical protein